MFAPIDLAALVAVADAGSVRAAAAQLGRTQPAVTQAIRRLETAVGFPLLDRTTYRARLTAQGDTFVRRARSTVAQMRSLGEFAALLAAGVEPRIRIAIDGATPTDAWLRVAHELAEQFPDTTAELNLGQDLTPLRTLEAGVADLAILFDATFVGASSTLESRPLGVVEFVNIVRSDRAHLLQKSKALIPQILVTDFAEHAQSYGLAPGQRYWRVASHQMQVDAILAGVGWGSVPASLVGEALTDGRLRSLAYFDVNERSQNPFSLYRRRIGPHGPVATHLWNKIRAEQ